MQEIRISIVLLATILAAPVAETAERTTGQITAAVGHTQRAVAQTDETKQLDHADDDDDLTGELEERSHIDQKGIAGGNVIKDNRRRARDEARDQRNRDREHLRGEGHEERSGKMDGHKKRMHETGTGEQHLAPGDEIEPVRSKRHEQDRDGYGKRGGMARDQQEEKKVVPDGGRAAQEEIKKDYAERPDAAETADQRQAIQAKIPVEPVEPVEQQNEKKPWWKFWGD